MQAGDRNLIVVVATTLEDRNDALGNLGTLLLIGGPVALLLASLAGYGVASASLRPVERMRRRAAAISRPNPVSGCRYRRRTTRSAGSDTR